jgi:uncharacterized phosphosugar-binding protein
VVVEGTEDDVADHLHRDASVQHADLCPTVSRSSGANPSGHDAESTSEKQGRNVDGWTSHRSTAADGSGKNNMSECLSSDSPKMY